jgi:hypothetical protein
MRANKVNAAILQCLEHVATGTSPPGAGAADFLLRLLDHDVFSVDEMGEITLRVSTIISGILERGAMSAGHPSNATIDEITARRMPAPPATASYAAPPSMPLGTR